MSGTNVLYTLENVCGRGCPCHFKEHYTHLNLVRKKMKEGIDPIKEGIDPPPHSLETKWINVRGREEHEAILKDAVLCKEFGLDQAYEIMVYLKRWGGWLSE